MCDFCENIKNQKNFKLDLEADGELFYNSKEHKHYIVLNDVQEGYYYELEVDFCPYCGRKLSEETEKPSIDEIAEILKEELTADEYLKLKENAKMFSDAVDGLWKILNKGFHDD